MEGPGISYGLLGRLRVVPCLRAAGGAFRTLASTDCVQCQQPAFCSAARNRILTLTATIRRLCSRRRSTTSLGDERLLPCGWAYRGLPIGTVRGLPASSSRARWLYAYARPAGRIMLIGPAAPRARSPAHRSSRPTTTSRGRGARQPWRPRAWPPGLPSRHA